MCWIEAAKLHQTRSSVLSHAPPSPLWVGIPGAERRVNIWVASHSSTRSVLWEGVQSVGDQERECMLKSPTSSVGMVESRSKSISDFKELVNDRGNPGVAEVNPYPYPPKT